MHRENRVLTMTVSRRWIVTVSALATSPPVLTTVLMLMALAMLLLLDLLSLPQF